MLTVICPTRGRPDGVREAWESFIAHTELDDTELVFAVGDDEDIGPYDPRLPLLIVPRQRWMNEILQSAVDRVLAEKAPSFLGFIGDDNRFLSYGWDNAVIDAFRAQGGGFVHCNDLHRHDIPTHVFVTAEIVRRLGYFGLPGSRHLYLDSAWKVLGDGAHCITYLPDVIIEHRHPIIGKAEMDDSYRASNAPEMYAHDADVFHRWLDSAASRDIEIVRSTLV